jgi:23S rRNA pseudouridine2605 synthase
MPLLRLQKILSTAGISSRRASELLITDGRVSVNGETITELGSKADAEVDDIRVDGRRIRTATPRRYILMYKPRGYITSRSDPQQRPTVIDLLAKGGVRDYVYPVGRLDYESEGLLILTSDGELAERLMHPSHGVAREYQARVRGVPARNVLERLAHGVILDGRKTAPAEATLERVIESAHGDDAVLSIVLHEGRNRQVRRMCVRSATSTSVRENFASSRRARLPHSRETRVPAEPDAPNPEPPPPPRLRPFDKLRAVPSLSRDRRASRIPGPDSVLVEQASPETNEVPHRTGRGGAVDLGVGDQRGCQLTDLDASGAQRLGQ